MDEATKKQAKAAVVQFISENNEQTLQLVDELLNVGYPIDEPVVDQTGQTLLMLCCSSSRLKLEVL